MSVITGKSIYILGAGASHHTGIPLLGDFLFSARQLVEGENPLRYRDAFNLVFAWIDGLRGSSYYVNLDLNNLEHIFSLAEMDRQIHPGDRNDVVKELRYLVSETIDHSCQLIFEGDHLPPDKLYGQFVSTLHKLNYERQKLFPRTESSFDPDAVITFNYDVMLDNALFYHTLKPEYFLTPGEAPQLSPKSVKLCKLHGSTNWAKCQDCNQGKEQLQIITPTPVSQSYVHFGHTEHDVMPFKMATEILSRAQCLFCEQKNTLEPFLIAPTWSKKIEGTPITTVWKAAVEEMFDAFQIIVIGYSLPKTDTFFQYLLMLALGGNPKLHRVVVVDVDHSNDFRGRYEKVFSRSLTDRGSLKFLTPTKFEEFVERYMPVVGKQTEWPYE